VCNVSTLNASGSSHSNDFFFSRKLALQNGRLKHRFSTMFFRTPIVQKRSILADLIIVLGVASLIYGSFVFAAEWESKFNPSFNIDLSFQALPVYSLFSAMRGLGAYLISLAFTLVVGYWAAKSTRAEKIILPLLDIFQSIPVLGFLPGLVLGLVAIFPHTNVGLELAALLMIFTGQVWNMTFAFYSSLKSVPGDLKEAADVMGLSKSLRFVRLELPYSAVNLVWNSIMSMAGGWFFLTVCESFTLGNKEYRLPGLGAYMAVAIEKGDTQAMIAGILAMAFVIIILDLLIWRPALTWVHKFRLEVNSPGVAQDHLLQFIFKNSKVLRFFNRRLVHRHRRKLMKSPIPKMKWKYGRLPAIPNIDLRGLSWILGIAFIGGFLYATYRLFGILTSITASQWWLILSGTGLTFLRVCGSLLIATLWALPAGIWLSQGQRRLKIAQPLAQLMASFPAPMLYPLILGISFQLGIQFSWSSMILMLLGVQWYVLFNTLAGGLRISQEIEDSMNLMGVSTWEKWRYLYIPSVFPALVTGWVTAAGGAWNASIVAEYLSYKGETIQTLGLGSLISHSAAQADFPMLTACLVVMVLFVILLNRFVWDRIYKVSQTRFRLDF
jgi:NitT/TauT family transport system permease protein